MTLYDVSTDELIRDERDVEPTCASDFNFIRNSLALRR